MTKNVTSEKRKKENKVLRACEQSFPRQYKKTKTKRMINDKNEFRYKPETGPIDGTILNKV